jgi:biotin carboxyl carrier protein
LTRRLVLVFRGEDGSPRELVLEPDGAELSVRLAGAAQRLAAVRLPDGRISLLLEDGRQFCARGLRVDGNAVELSSSRGRRRISLADPLRDRLAHAKPAAGATESEEEVRAMMSGRVVEVSVRPGDRVEPGSLLLVLEAMKMQNEIRSDRGGVVERVAVTAGDAVDGGCLMVRLRTAAD